MWWILNFQTYLNNVFMKVAIICHMIMLEHIIADCISKGVRCLYVSNQVSVYLKVIKKYCNFLLEMFFSLHFGHPVL